jgi:menaquinone-dependent protoporphyrinogen IX oxidase
VSTNHTNPRICIIYFSLSGQSRGLINLLAAGIRSRGVEVVIEQIRSVEQINFPFNSVLRTLKMMLTTFFRVRIPVLEPSRRCFGKFDLMVLAGPTWSYNPCGPVLSLLDEYGEKLFGSKTVIPLISCRGYHRMHEYLLKRQLQSCGATPSPAIVFHHPVAEPWSTIGVFLKSAGYRPEKMSILAGRYGHFGHTVDQLIEARSIGEQLADDLLQQPLQAETSTRPAEVQESY